MLKRITLVAIFIILVTNVTTAQMNINWNNTRTFVGQMYTRILDRRPNKAEVVSVSVLLIKCEAEREDVIRTMFFSYEYQTIRARTNYEFVYDAYYAILRRYPSGSEADPHINALNTGQMSREQMIESFLSSQEYLTLTQYENDCLLGSKVAFYHVWPDGGHTTQDICDAPVLDIPELKKFELILLVTNLSNEQYWPFKGQVFFMADVPYMGNSWAHSVKARKYGYWHEWPQYHNAIKFGYHLLDGYVYEPTLPPQDWNPLMVYDIRMIVSDLYVTFYINGVPVIQGPKTCEWDPVDMLFWAGSYGCNDGPGYEWGFGSIPGTTYISLKIIDLE